MRRKRRKSCEKSKTLFQHTKRRLAERHGLYYTQYLQDTIRSKIKNADCKTVAIESNRVVVYDVSYVVHPNDVMVGCKHQPGEEINIRVVYDENRKTIITVLLEGMACYPKKIVA